MSFSRSLWIIPLGVLLYSGDVVAQEHDAPVSILDLNTLVETIRENNPDLRASRLEAEALSLRHDQVSSLPDPRASITYQPYPLFTARGTQRTQWRVEQAVPFPGKLGLKGDIADFGADIAKYEALTFEQDLVFEAKRAYYELYRIQRQQGLIQAFRLRLQDFEENAATRYVVGTGMQQAILKAQLERNALLQRDLSLELLHRSATEKLARLLNTPVSEIELGEVETPTMPELNEATLLEAALRLRPEAKALSVVEERTDAQIALAEKEFFPDFGFNVTYFDIGSASIPATATGRDALAIGVSLNIPLWRGRAESTVGRSANKEKPGQGAHRGTGHCLQNANRRSGQSARARKSAAQPL